VENLGGSGEAVRAIARDSAVIRGAVEKLNGW
jgi:hypothetical protein